MCKMYSVCLVGILAFLILATPSSGQPWGVMKVDTMVGDSSIDGYQGWSDILSYSISVQNGGWNIWGDPLPPSLSDMYITKQLDGTSPMLFGAVLTQEHFNDPRVYDAQIHVVTLGAGGQPVATVKWLFNDVVVSAYNTVYEGAMPLELVALDYGEITYTYIPIAPDGTQGPPVSFTYNRHVGELTWSGDIANGFQFVTQFQTTSVPEPATLLLLLGSISLGIPRFRRRA